MHDNFGVKRVKIGVFNQKRLEKQENNTSCPCPCARRMVWCAGVHGAVMIVVPCALHMDSRLGVLEAASPMCIQHFSTLFNVFFHLAMPWNFKWIFCTLYCLQMSSKNHQTSTFILLILHLMSYFVDLHGFSLKRLNTPLKLHDYDKSELQRLEWKQYKLFLKPLTTPLNYILFGFIRKKNN